MQELIDLILDIETTGGRLATSAAIVAMAVLASFVIPLLLRRRLDDPLARYNARKFTRYIVGAIALIAIGLVWRAFAGRIGLVLGLLSAGLAFALQEVIGAVAGWVNIISGSIFRVGDRIQMGGVRGDVIDVTLLRTKLMEIGSPASDETWVRGRQYTGRIVAVSNKMTFTEPVYNYSAAFEFIWEELTIPVSYRSDWELAEKIIREEAEQVSRSEGAREAMEQMVRRYPVPMTEVEPRVFVRATDNWMELAARFIVPVRTARSVKDGMTRRIRRRLEEAGIEISSETFETTVRFPAGDAGEEEEGAGGPRSGGGPPSGGGQPSNDLPDS